MTSRYRPSSGIVCECGGPKHYQSLRCQSCWADSKIRPLEPEPPASMTPEEIADAVAKATLARPLTEEEDAIVTRGALNLAAVIKTGLLPHARKVRPVEDYYLSAKDRADIERERAGRRNREAA